MKEGDFAREASFWIWERKQAKFPMILLKKNCGGRCVH
jgi:hypothetical protein